MDWSKHIRMFSLLGQRGTYGTVLSSLAKDHNDIYALTADLCNTSGLDRFAEMYPDRFLNVGIAEQNMIGVAGGIADCGYIPFVSTFANFASLRANEFVRHFMAYMNCNIKLIGLGSGFAMEFFGNTHYAMEDIAVLRSFPNIKILSPADGLEVAKCVEYAYEHKGPVYIRLSGLMNNPIVYKKDYIFNPEQMIELKDGSDVLIYATGSMVCNALKAADELYNKGIAAKVVNVHTIKPIDHLYIKNNLKYKLLVSIEEHSIVGGLGTAISEQIAKYSSPRLLVLGTNGYKKAGDYNYMLMQNRLLVEQIVEDIYNEYNNL